MRLALVQMEGQDIRDYEKTIGKIIDLIIKACEEEADFIILPECAYPSYILGIDEEMLNRALNRTDELIEKISSLCKSYKVYVAIGLPVVEDGNLYNGTLVFNREGKIINSTYKRNLWHFDGKWFKAGEEGLVFDTEFGKIGVMICADGRIPEVAAMLKEQGAQLIIDPVNLVASAATPEALSNQQYEFILQARARENGVFIAVADKCGVERNLVTYLGRSFVINPEGEVILECSPDKEEIGICDIDLSQSRKVHKRRPELYAEMIKPTEDLPIVSKIETSYRIEDLGLYTMVIRFQYDTREEYVEKAIRYIKGGEILSARFIVLPELRQPLLLEDKLIDTIQRNISGETIVSIAGSAEKGIGYSRFALILSSQGILGKIEATHCADMGNSDEIGVIKITHSCSVGAVFDWEIDISEIARTAMLKGADILIHYDDGSDDWRLKMIRTRAAENRMFVVRSSSSREPDCSFIISPDGGQICTTFKSLEHSSTGYINTALSKFKNVVPGTHIIHGRHPNNYNYIKKHS